MKDIMVFCTCAENNYQFYLARIDNWYTFCKDINADFFVFVDGVLPDQQKQKRQYLHFVQHRQKLGLCSSEWWHSGWKRSVCSALKMGRDYKYIIHIENDVLIFNCQSVQKKIRTGKNICGWVQDGQYMQTAMMTLNDKQVNQKIIQYYADENNLKSHQCTQAKFQTFTEWKLGGFTGSNVGIIARDMSFDKKVEHIRNLHVDYWGQFYYWGFDYINGEFKWTKNRI